MFVCELELVLICLYPGIFIFCGGCFVFFYISDGAKNQLYLTESAQALILNKRKISEKQCFLIII